MNLAGLEELWTGSLIKNKVFVEILVHYSSWIFAIFPKIPILGLFFSFYALKSSKWFFFQRLSQFQLKMKLRPKYDILFQFISHIFYFFSNMAVLGPKMAFFGGFEDPKCESVADMAKWA